MEKREYRRNANAMIYLVSCALNQRTPKAELVSKIDLEQLFEVCQKHILTACTAYALESAGVHNNDFTQAKEKAIRKNILLDVERSKILNRLEEAGIWYMPLKGAILKDWYPKLGMRQMSDNDILFDMSRREDVRAIMQELDVKLHTSLEVVDEFVKEPVYNFEMHGELFMEYQVGGLADYYRGIKNRIQKDDRSRFGYRFSLEEFYLFMLAHEYKHFSLGGTGVRSLSDTYVFIKKFGSQLDWAYIRAELEKMEIAEFEKNNRELAMKVFDRQKLTDEEKKLLDYYIFSGTYGTAENKMENALNQHNDSKLKYVLDRIFPSYEYMRCAVPWVKDRKQLLPAAWGYRILRGCVQGFGGILNEIRLLNKQ